MQVQPYVFFDGRCEEAAEFYRKAIGAEVTMLMRYKDAPPNSGPSMVTPGSEGKVMHMALRIGESTVLASDGMCSGTTNFQGFSLTIEVKDENEAKRLFDGLSNGGEIRMPLAKTFFSPAFGMLADRFGVAWIVIVSA